MKTYKPQCCSDRRCATGVSISTFRMRPCLYLIRHNTYFIKLQLRFAAHRNRWHCLSYNHIREYFQSYVHVRGPFYRKHTIVQNKHKPVSKFISISAVNPLKPKLIWIIFKNPVRTAKKTQLFTITKINWLTLFKEIISVYSVNHTKLINTLSGQNAELLNVKDGGIYSYHWARARWPHRSYKMHSLR
jgi:hypothetical protein